MFARIVNYLMRCTDLHNSSINVACPFSISILSLVSIFEHVTGISAKYDLVDFGTPYSINTDLISEILPKLGINFDDNYIEKVIRKYY